MDKVIVVGAGISGATIARLFAENGYEVTVIDRRDTIGGNAFDYRNKNGIIVQPYGPHIFHTNSEKVYKFLTKFTDWREYRHKVLAKIRKDKLVPVPFNLNSLHVAFSKKKAERLEEILIAEFGEGARLNVMELKNHPNHEIRDFGEYVYKHVFYIYTMKQWGYKPERLSAEIMGRVPVVLSRNDEYFDDKYQVMPEDGFSMMIANILRHPHIKIKLKTNAATGAYIHEGQIYLRGKPFDGIVVYTGSVDELFEYKHGVLPYRTVKFRFEYKRVVSYQSSAVINYTVSGKQTRVTEFSKFTSEPSSTGTVIVKEIPKKHKKGKNEPYYPIPLEKNIELFNKYKQEAEGCKNLYLLGRLGNYKYINLDQAVENAIELFERITGEEVDIESIRETKIGRAY